MSNKKDRAVVHVELDRSEHCLDRGDIVIIGSGIAGLASAIEARRCLPDKGIVIITDRLHPTINTPALKQFAVARLTREQLLAYPAGIERAERIQVVNAHVEEIEAQSKYMRLSGNRCFGYNSLLIATGSSPVGLPEEMPGRGFDGVMTLRRLEDYLDLRRRLPEVHEAVVIGGGIHGCETVMALLYWGIRVHWIIRNKAVMARILDQTASEMMLNNVKRAGAIVHIETEVIGIIGRAGTVAGVITNQEKLIGCQLVLMCMGAQPEMTLAQRCSVPLQCENGILVDDDLHTNVLNIYAAGDVAALHNPQMGTYETRPQWYAAITQGRIAGAVMAGYEGQVRRSLGVPWYATQLGALSMLTVGDPLNEDSRVTILTDSSRGAYYRLAIIGDNLIGYLFLGPIQSDSLAIKQIIDEGHSIGDLTKAILKGTFDAHRYLSQQKSYALRKWMTVPSLKGGNKKNSTKKPG